ncbi:MAG: ATP synthase F1 subunit gamma [Crocinitomicaceae bacterium]|nr:ATP synthase F1 subunit gamma [Crocinitomicaceae bacterium]
MANLKEIRSRITSVSSTMQITSAMKMVSASKLKRAQDAITQMRPYSEKLQEILSNLSATLDLSENAYADEREVKNVLIIAISSNRGLCGGFNNNIIKEVNNLVNHTYADKNVNMLCYGKKAIDAFRRNEARIDNKTVGVEDIFADLKFSEISEIASHVMEMYLTKKVDKVVVVYNSFINAATQIVKTEQFLPIIPTVSETETSTGDYIFEPSKEEIVAELLPKSLKIQLFKSILDSHASEHGARMTAMHKATDNAEDLKRSLTLSYNKARQAAITNEILEIVGGAEALNN